MSKPISASRPCAFAIGNDQYGWAIYNDGRMGELYQITKTNVISKTLFNGRRNIYPISVTTTDSNHAWIGCDSGYVFIYHYGTWTQIKPDSSDNITCVYALDTNYVWFGHTIGHISFLHNQNWSIQHTSLTYLPTRPNGVSGIVFIDTNLGYAYSEDGFIIKTTNGGDSTMTTESQKTALKPSYRLQNSPNPFNPSTTITFSLKASERAVLRVFSPSGQVVSTLLDGIKFAGDYSINFDGSKFSSGIYVVELKTPNRTERKIISLLK